jgi:RHS repeat-associated protein
MAQACSTFYYDKRLQPCRISVKSSGTAPVSCTDAADIGNVIDFAYNFSLGVADNGNVMGITNNRDTTRSQQFTYDALNRISTAETTSTHATSPANCWGDQFGYDAWGNLLSISPVSSAYTGCTYQPLSVVATASNQISGDTYDAAGNLIVAQPGSTSYTYNAENQLTSTAGVTYKYDGDGKRVEKTSGKLYWYGTGSDPLMETDLSGNLTDEYIFFGGKRIARRDSSGNVVYYVADHLGTSRIVASSAGAILDQSDFYPFGGERVISASSGNTYKFTSKERDSESNLDNFGARYNSSSIGRFMSPDPSGLDLADWRDPQQLNLYSYVRNNPLTLTDPYGLDCAYLNNAGNGVESIDRNSSGGECADTGGYWVDQTADANSFHDNGNGFATMQNTNGTSYLFCTGGDCSQPPSFSMGGPPPNDAISNDPFFDGVLFGALGGVPGLLRGGASLAGDIFGTGARAATETAAEEAGTQAGRIVFKHGVRHLAGTGLEQAAVENAIKADVQQAVAKATTSGNFWGKVVVNGQEILYKAWTLPDGTINVGTYFKP